MQHEHGEPQLPIAVVAGVEVNGLGVVRSFARVGIPTIALDTDLTKPTLATRFGKKVEVPALSGEAFVHALLSVAASLDQKPVLILTQEDSVETVSAARDQLSDAYLFSMPSQDTMQLLMNKSTFQRCAESLRCPIPRSVRLLGELAAESMSELQFPCVIKPVVKSVEYSAKFSKASKVASAREAADLWLKMRDVVGEVIMQEWIEGDDSDVYFCLQYRGLPGTTPVSFVGRKICQWPPQVGGTASCTPAPDVSHELIVLTNDFFDAVGFVGLGSMEYKRDKRDKKFYMVEPTVGRTDYQEEVATLNGVNIPYAAYCGELGRPFPPAEPIDPPMAWRDSVSYRKARSAGAPDPMLEICPNAKIIDAHFRPDDPLPYFLQKLEPVNRRLKRLVGRA